MRAEIVLDASVAMKCVLEEEGSQLARAVIESASRVVAPDLIFVEVANAIVKSLRRRGADTASGVLALSDAGRLVEEVFPTPPLVGPAFALAADFGLSAHDAAYLVLARERGARMVTSDLKLARRVAGTELAPFVSVL